VGRKRSSRRRARPAQAEGGRVVRGGEYAVSAMPSSKAMDCMRRIEGWRSRQTAAGLPPKATVAEGVDPRDRIVIVPKMLAGPAQSCSTSARCRRPSAPGSDRFGVGRVIEDRARDGHHPAAPGGGPGRLLGTQATATGAMSWWAKVGGGRDGRPRKPRAARPSRAGPAAPRARRRGAPWRGAGTRDRGRWPAGTGPGWCRSGIAWRPEPRPPAARRRSPIPLSTR